MRGGSGDYFQGSRHGIFVSSCHATIPVTWQTGSSRGRLAAPIFSWGTFRRKRPNVTLAASSGFDQLSMIALASSRILELGVQL
jgi:hypothetical protein